MQYKLLKKHLICSIVYALAYSQPIFCTKVCAKPQISHKIASEQYTHNASVEQSVHHMIQYKWFLNGEYEHIIQNTKHSHDLITECAKYINAHLQHKTYKLKKSTDEHTSKMLSTLLSERIHKILSSYNNHEEFAQYKHELDILKTLFESLEHHPLENDHVLGLIEQHHQHHESNMA